MHVSLYKTQLDWLPIILQNPLQKHNVIWLTNYSQKPFKTQCDLVEQLCKWFTKGGGLRPIKRTHWKPLKKRDLIPIIPKNPFKKHATLFVSLSKTQCNLVINYSLKSLQKHNVIWLSIIPKIS
jgi:hypothetical protein